MQEHLLEPAGLSRHSYSMRGLGYFQVDSQWTLAATVLTQADGQRWRFERRHPFSLRTFARSDPDGEETIRFTRRPVGRRGTIALDGRELAWRPVRRRLPLRFALSGPQGVVAVFEAEGLVGVRVEAHEQLSPLLLLFGAWLAGGYADGQRAASAAAGAGGVSGGAASAG